MATHPPLPFPPLCYLLPRVHSEEADTKPVPLLVTLLGQLVCQSVTAAVVHSSPPSCCRGCCLIHGCANCEQRSSHHSLSVGDSVGDCPLLEAICTSVSILCWVCEHGPTAAAAAAVVQDEEEEDKERNGRLGKGKSTQNDAAAAGTAAAAADAAAGGGARDVPAGTFAGGDPRATIGEMAMQGKKAGKRDQAGASGVGDPAGVARNAADAGTGGGGVTARAAASAATGGAAAGGAAAGGAAAGQAAALAALSAAASSAPGPCQEMDVDECSPSSDKEAAEGGADEQVLAGAKLQVLLSCCEWVSQQLQILLFVPVTAREPRQSQPSLSDTSTCCGDKGGSQWEGEDVMRRSVGTHRLICLIVERFVSLLGALEASLAEAVAVLTCSNRFWEQTTRRLRILCSTAVDVADSLLCSAGVSVAEREENKPIAVVGTTGGYKRACWLIGSPMSWSEPGARSLFGQLHKAVHGVQKATQFATEQIMQ